MAKNSKHKMGSKSGYGLPNINKNKVSKKDISIILKKRWQDISSLDLYKLYQAGFKTEDLSVKFKTTIINILNRLRYQ
tara:strand:+ start:15539 stop:15772 length:234 start_codon:yes stop_codon:yes gene_type:complete